MQTEHAELATQSLKPPKSFVLAVARSPQMWKIGTRGSALALAQAHETRALLCATHGMREDQFEIVVISTSGDRIQDRPLSEVGGKGLFSKEIEDLLLSGEIDIAVHSTKDMATTLPHGLCIAAFLKREDPRDGFIGREVSRLRDLPQGATIGSSSLRRLAQIKLFRSDLNVVMFRGNVQTRLKKLREGQVDGTILAMAGLKRLGLADQVTEILDPYQFLPAPGQGAICIEIRERDGETFNLVNAISDYETAICVLCERAFLRALNGDCRTPLAGAAVIIDDKIHFNGIVLTPDGEKMQEVAVSGKLTDCETVGTSAARLIDRSLLSSWA